MIAQVPRDPRPWGTRFVKRGFDLALASLLLVVTLPVLAFACIAIRLESSGSPIYRQRRVGRAGDEFDLLKLRTLRNDVLRGIREPGEHARMHEADTSKLTWSGRRVLKPWYLDELPQLLNVLRGDMTLVGPRPWPPTMVAAQVGRGVDYRLRLRAGWTGPAQVSKGEDVSFEKLDLAYVERCEHSGGLALAWYDLGILRRTLVTMLRGQGLSY